MTSTAFDNAQDDHSLIKNFKESAITAAKALLPELPKLILSLGVTLMGAGYFGKVLENTVGHVKSAVDSVKDMYGEDTFSDIREAVDENIQDAIKERFEKHEADKQTLESFKQALRELAANKELNPKPLVFIIDELDRCNPLFSVRMIERIKHFFDIPNIVFVLVTDKQQLQATICYQFGYNDQMGEAYLDKFIDFSIKLERPMNDNRNKEFLLVISDTLFKLGFSEKEINDYKYATLIFAVIRNSSIRQIIKNLNRFSLLQAEGNQKNIILLYKLFNPIIDNQLPLFMYMLYDFIRYFDKQTFNLTDSTQLEKYISEVAFTFDEKFKEYRFSHNLHSIENQISHSMLQDLSLFFNKLSMITYRFLSICKYPNGRENELLKDFCSQFSIKSYALPLELNHQWDEYIKTEPPRVSRRPNFLREYPNEKYLLT